MWTLIMVAWWAILLAAARQAWRAWGTGPAVATVLGLWILSAQIEPWTGTIVSAAAAVWIGARAERRSSGRVRREQVETYEPVEAPDVSPRHVPTSS